MRYILGVTALLLPLCGCDAADEQTNIVTQGVRSANEARDIAASSAEQHLQMAADLISLGKLTDAENLLNQLLASQDTLTPAANAKLRALQERLAAAKGR